MKQIEAQFDKLPSIQQMFERYIGSFMGGWSQMTTNFRNVAIEIFLPILPYLTRGMQSVSGALTQLSNFLNTHKKAGLDIAIGAFATMATFAFIAGKSLLDLNGAIITMGVVAKANAKLLNGTNLANAAGAGESVASKAGRWGGIAWLGTMAASLGKSLLGYFEHRGPQGAGILLRRPGILGTAVDWEAIVPTILRIGGAVSGFVGELAAFAGRFVPVIGWFVMLGQVVYQFFHNPFQMGEWLGKIVGWFTFKFFPGVESALQTGWSKVSTFVSGLWNSILSGIVGLIHQLYWVATHPWDAARVAAQAGASGISSLVHTIKVDYGKASAGVQHGMGEEAHQNILGSRAVRDLHVHIHTNTNDPKKHAKQVSMELTKMLRSDLRVHSSTPTLPHTSRMTILPA
jgi:hypothetical protein